MYFKDTLSCLSLVSLCLRNLQCHISRLYAFESAMPVPPGTVAYEMEAGESRDASWGTFRPEKKVPDDPETERSIDKEGVILGVLYMLLNDILG